MDPLLILLIALVIVVGGITILRLHAFLALIVAALVVGALAPPEALEAQGLAGESVGARVADAFGATAAGIGILIAMAAIIGKCLLDSGGAERIVLSAQRLLGEKRTPQAFVASGFILGIPVYADTVFYLLLPLAKAMWVHTRRNYLLYVLCIVAGATMTHSLVPPTPGPLLVADALGIDVGVMMLGGIIVGICTVTVGYFYNKWANRRWDIPLRPSAELTQEQIDAIAMRDTTSLPSLWLSLLPIALPVVLIAGAAVIERQYADGGAPWYAAALLYVGEKNLALTIAAAASILLLILRPNVDRKQMAEAMQSALLSAGIIILITSAGGALGKMLQQTGIADVLRAMMPESKLFILPIAFMLTVLVRTAQGSATVSMITAVGIVAPLAAAGDLGYHPVYLALAIGCGSKPGMWMNDSGFWVISKMSGLTEVETLKTAAAVLTVMGFTGLIVTMLGAWLLPLV